MIVANWIFKNWKPANEKRLTNDDFKYAESFKLTGTNSLAEEITAQKKLRSIDLATACEYHIRRGYMLVKITL